jgi:hypothetical protein
MPASSILSKSQSLLALTASIHWSNFVIEHTRTWHKQLMSMLLCMAAVSTR